LVANLVQIQLKGKMEIRGDQGTEVTVTFQRSGIGDQRSENASKIS